MTRWDKFCVTYTSDCSCYNFEAHKITKNTKNCLVIFGNINARKMNLLGFLFDLPFCCIENLFLYETSLRGICLIRAVEFWYQVHSNLPKEPFSVPVNSSQSFNLPSRLKSIKHVHSNLKMFKVERRSERREQTIISNDSTFFKLDFFTLPIVLLHKRIFSRCTFFFQLCWFKEESKCIRFTGVRRAKMDLEQFQVHEKVEMK